MVNRKELDPDSSPKAAFGARMRTWREERHWTQDELADRMGYSSTHLSSIETGRKMPTLRLARRADVAFGAEETFERAWRVVRNAGLLEGFPQFVDLEAEAAEIRIYEVGVVPGLLQTPEYATVIAQSAVKRGAITGEQAEERIALVTERQATLARTPPPLIFVVVDESCLRRPVGEPVVMEAQFARLIEFAEMPNTVLQVAPFNMGVRRPLRLPVYLLTLPDRSLVAYSDSAQRGHLERDSTFVLPLLTAYHQLQAEAPSQAACVDMLDKLRKGTL